MIEKEITETYYFMPSDFNEKNLACQEHFDESMGS